MPKPLKIKDSIRESKLFSQRSVALIVVLVALALILGIRLYVLQVHQHERYTTLSEANELSLIPIEPNRGLIFDRNGVLIAENTPIFSLDIIPAKIKNLKQTINDLNKIIEISSKDRKDFFKLIKHQRRFESVPLKLKLTETERAKFAINQWRFPGVEVNARLMRNYPLGSVLVPVLGYTGRINEQELEKVDQTNYSPNDIIGKAGIEKYFEQELHGTFGYQQVENDVSGRIVRVLKRTPPIAGQNLYLTIDSNLQQIANNALGDERGAVIIMKPDTGEILALVSKPSYDPNLFAQGIELKDYKALQASPDKPLYNRAIRGLYPSGSTVKPFYALKGLESNIVTPEYKIHDTGIFWYGGRGYRDWKKGGHGTVDAHKAIVISCDIYFYNLANRMGIDRMASILRAFGFGQLSHIELLEELPGVVPDGAWKRRVLHAPWYGGDTISAGVGQGYFLVTPLQLATAVSAIATKGKRMQPHLLSRLGRADGVMFAQKPIEIGNIKIQEENWDLVRDAMKDVVQPGGTAYSHFGPNVPYTVAGKTGTAQTSGVRYDTKVESTIPYELRDNSLFIAFAPVEKPEIAMAVLVEHRHGFAPDVAHQIMDYYFVTSKLPPQKSGAPIAPGTAAAKANAVARIAPDVPNTTVATTTASPAPGD